jgi:hypothetical protein
VDEQEIKAGWIQFVLMNTAILLLLAVGAWYVFLPILHRFTMLKGWLTSK